MLHTVWGLATLFPQSIFSQQVVSSSCQLTPFFEDWFPGGGVA